MTLVFTLIVIKQYIFQNSYIKYLKVSKLVYCYELMIVH